MQIVNGWAFPDEDEFMAKEMKPDGTYQLSHLTGAIAYCKKFELAVDGGAHIGTWSKVLSKKFAKVVSFEPSVDTFECLQHNIGTIPNIEMLNKALGKSPGKISMTLEGFQRAIDMKNTGARLPKKAATLIASLSILWNCRRWIS